MGIDIISYIIGANGAEKEVTIEGSITCVDDGQGNITITEEGN